MAQVGFCSLSGTLCTPCLLATYRTSEILSPRAWTFSANFLSYRRCTDRSFIVWTHCGSPGRERERDSDSETCSSLSAFNESSRRSFAAASELSGIPLLAFVLREFTEWGAFAAQTDEGRNRAWEGEGGKYKKDLLTA